MDNTIQTPKTVFGKNIIEMLMFNMYDECKVIYREYIQNSFDAIQEAVARNLLPNVNNGIVNVEVDSKHRTVTIRDNGTGISFDKAPSALLNIAASEKDGYVQAGQYGVGRLVGAGFCSRLVFRTKASGEKEGTEVIINSDLARSIIRDKNNRSDAVTVMSEISEVRRITDSDEHFFEVILENIKEGYDELLSVDEIISYLSAVAPIDYSMPFKNLLISKNEEFKKLYSRMKYVNVSVNNKPIKKKYGTTVIGTGDEILGIEVFHLIDEDGGELAWGWYAITPFTKQIPELYNDELEPNRGIRLRKNNIQIGDEKLLDKWFQESRGNHYFYGEVHIVSSAIVPDSTRQGLASTHEAIQFHELLKNKFKELHQIYTRANELKGAVRDLNVGIFKVNSDNEDIDKIQAKGEVEKALAKIESTSNKVIDIAPSVTPLVEYYQGKAKEVQENGGVPVEKKKKDKPTVKIVASDELSVLSDKYSAESIKVIRKIFVLLRRKWESDNKATLEKLIADIIKALK